MPCTSCGAPGPRTQLAPGYFKCKNLLQAQRATGAHPSGAQGPAYVNVSWPCATEYQEADASISGGATCSEHLLFSIGLCAEDKVTPVCGRDPQQLCLNCRTKRAEADSAARRIAEEQVAAFEAENRRIDDQRAAAAECAHQAKVDANPHHWDNQEKAVKRLYKVRERSSSLASVDGWQGVGDAFWRLLAFALACVLIFAAFQEFAVGGAGNVTYGVGAGLIGLLILRYYALIQILHAVQKRRYSAAVGCGDQSCSRCHLSGLAYHDAR